MEVKSMDVQDNGGVSQWRCKSMDVQVNVHGAMEVQVNGGVGVSQWRCKSMEV